MENIKQLKKECLERLQKKIIEEDLYNILGVYLNENDEVTFEGLYLKEDKILNGYFIGLCFIKEYKKKVNELKKMEKQKKAILKDINLF